MVEKEELLNELDDIDEKARDIEFEQRKTNDALRLVSDKEAYMQEGLEEVRKSEQMQDDRTRRRHENLRKEIKRTREEGRTTLDEIEEIQAASKALREECEDIEEDLAEMRDCELTPGAEDQPARELEDLARRLDDKLSRNAQICADLRKKKRQLEEKRQNIRLDYEELRKKVLDLRDWEAEMISKSSSIGEEYKQASVSKFLERLREANDGSPRRGSLDRASSFRDVFSWESGRSRGFASSMRNTMNTMSSLVSREPRPEPAMRPATRQQLKEIRASTVKIEKIKGSIQKQLIHSQHEESDARRRRERVSRVGRESSGLWGFLVQTLHKIGYNMLFFNEMLLEDRCATDPHFDEYMTMFEESMELGNKTDAIKDERSVEKEELTAELNKLKTIYQKLKNERQYYRERMESGIKVNLRVQSADLQKEIRRIQRLGDQNHDLKESIEHLETLLRGFKDQRKRRESNLGLSRQHLMDLNKHWRDDEDSPRGSRRERRRHSYGGRDKYEDSSEDFRRRADELREFRDSRGPKDRRGRSISPDLVRPITPGMNTRR